MKTIVVLLLVCLAGCQTTADVNYMAQLDAYRAGVAGQQAVEAARARAEEARYNAIGAIAERGDPASKQMAILALALGRSGSELTHASLPVQVPTIPESQDQRAFKWAALFAGPAISLVQGYFGYRLGVEQSRNTADSTIASYNVLGSTAVAGYGAAQGIAGAGFGALQSTAAAGIGAVQGIAGAGFATLTRPNVIVTNSGGVIGSGSWVGPNSGDASGNLGRIDSPDNNQRNCVPAVPPTPSAC